MEPLKIPDDRRAAVLIARFIRGKIKGPEEMELHNWMVQSDANFELFEKLTGGNREWASVWFADHGVDPKFLKKRAVKYGPSPDEITIKEFYIYSAIAFVCMVLYYILLRTL